MEVGNLPLQPCPKHSGTQGHGFIISDGPWRSLGAVFFSTLPVPAKTPAAPSVLFIKYTVQLCVCVQLGLWGLLAGVGDTCYCCSMGICHRNGMSCQTERPFPAVGPQQRDAA